MVFLIVPAMFATVSTILVAVLTDLSVGQLVASYYLMAAISGLIPLLRWPFSLGSLRILAQAKLWRANDEL